MLYIFGGLPGTGKSTLSSALARELRATYLRVDVVEQALRATGLSVNGPEGYIVCYEIAKQSLRLGHDVIADTVNPIHITCHDWRNVAESLEIPFVEIEVVCSDESEHRHRVLTRKTDISGLMLPTWDQVKNRHYEAWDRDHIIIDTANHTVEESLIELRKRLGLEN
ncbi:AAA family ATPase [Paenibacillus lupini]|uniref:AAA family ATPase n=1 Tax=Paenibacillus lupini TaxID=1450204 RepID=UPI00141DD654|nr:AAA family ATPase [Paenibacillus lupini]NIK21684.1 putative kinase [Paenibacillus lupini]